MIILGICICMYALTSLADFELLGEDKRGILVSISESHARHSSIKYLETKGVSSTDPRISRGRF